MPEWSFEDVVYSDICAKNELESFVFCANGTQVRSGLLANFANFVLRIIGSLQLGKHDLYMFTFCFYIAP